MIPYHHLFVQAHQNSSTTVNGCDWIPRFAYFYYVFVIL